MTNGISQPTHPGSTSRGLAWKQVTVLSIDGNTAVVIDQLTKTFSIGIDKMPAKGVAPARGDIWLVHRMYGAWTFGLCLNAPTKLKTSDIDGLDNSIGLINTFIAQHFYSFVSLEEQVVYGDLVSSCSRFVARDSIVATSANMTYVALLGTAGQLTIHGFRVAITTAAAGTLTVGIYLGSSNSALTLQATKTLSSAATGLFAVNLTTPVVVGLGQWIGVMINSSAINVALAGVSIGGVPGIMATEFGLTAQGSFVGSLPSTANLMSTSVIAPGSKRPWVALY